MNQEFGPVPTLAPSPEPQNWLLVDAIELLWLVPRAEATHLGELVPNRDTLPACGQVSQRNPDDPAVPAVYWNRRLQLGMPREDSCHSALILQTRLGALALACRRLMRVEQEPRFYQLPNCMRGRRHTFEQVAVMGGRTAAKVDTERLLKLLPESLRCPQCSQHSSLRG